MSLWYVITRRETGKVVEQAETITPEEVEYQNSQGVENGQPQAENPDGGSTQRNTPSIKYGVWFGHSAERFRAIFNKVYGLGTLNAAQFSVKLTPLGSAIKDIPMFDTEKYPIEFLAQSVDVSLFEGQTESMNVGHWQLNYITGNASNEIAVTFIETRDAVILNSAKAIKKRMFKQDGTQALPSEYLIRMQVSLFDRFNYGVKRFRQEWVVALTGGEVQLDATNPNGLVTVTLNFVKMYPFKDLHTVK